MAIKLVEIKCPNCGAVLNYEEGRKVLYCQYCGEKILVDDDNEYTYHHIDDAEVKQAETDQMVKMRWLEMEETERQRRYKAIEILVAICVGLLLIGIIGGNFGDGSMMICAMFPMIIGPLGIFAITESSKKAKNDFNASVGYIKIDQSSADLEGKDYKYVNDAMKACGFTNITLNAMGDLTFGLIYKPGRVDTVRINGEGFHSGDWFSPNAHVVISYHSK